ncbi:MAG: heme-binding protein [Pseudonocardiales bacterium]|nr:heme-binding protein [Pseudonocardiales bacterium]
MTGPALPLDLAQRVVTAALDAAAAERVPIAAVVVDAAGRVVSGARMDGVPWVNWEVAVRKAAAAAVFGAPTHVVRAMADEDPVLVTALAATDGEVLAVPGGFPVLVDGAPVGGLGLAGGHYLQDQQIGEKALAAPTAPEETR